MTTPNEIFGRLLRGAINSIAAYEGKTAAVVEEELGAAIGISGAAIQRYKAGALPPDPTTVQTLAQAAVSRGYLGAAWLRRFLQVARYPQPDALIARLVGGSTAVSPALPSGTLAFLFTDIEGSTQLWEQHRTAMEGALARHDALLRQTIDAHGGHVFATQGDAVHAAFTMVADALEAALVIQQVVQAERWTTPTPLRVRAAIHVGAAQLRDGDYYGPALNRIARLCAAGHGGQLLLSLAAQELVRDQLPHSVTLRDLGEHRLKDLGRPERVFQIVAPDLPDAFPALRTLDAYHHNLPAQATPLVGREAEAQAVVDLLQRATIRLLTLTGPGGIGKTRLALQVAAELLDAYPDGVWFVDLSPVRDPKLVLPTIAKVFEIADAGEKPLAERLAAYLRPRRALLLLDNVEQVADAAPQIADLLAAAVDIQVLATSREVLRLYGEQEYPVPPLTLPDLAKLPPLERLTQYEAVRLFIERAQAVRPEFQVTNETAPVVAEICARLDGLPLAIELAAARIRIFPPQPLLARLGNRLRLLASGPRNLPGRQQTLRDAIAWSYDLLSAEEQTLFARLGVFAGGFTLAAAEAICGDDVRAEATGWRQSEDRVHQELGEWMQQVPALEVALLAEDTPSLLESLVSKSLVRQIAGDGEARFTLLETIREYSLERLAASGEEQAVRWRHAGYYAGLHASTNIWTNAGAIAMLQIELDNLRAALAWAIESGAVLPGFIIGRDFTFWGERSNEGQRWLDALLAHRVPVSYAAAHAMYSVLTLARFNRDYSRARAGVRIYSQMLNDLGEAAQNVNFNLGYIALGEGQVAEAGVLFAQGLEMFRAGGGDDIGIAWGEYSLGSYHVMADDPLAAHACFARSLALFHAQGESLAVLDTLQKLGLVAQVQGDAMNAVTYFRESIKAARERRFRKMIGLNLLGFAGVALHRQQLERAAVLFGAAEALSETTSGYDPDQHYVSDRQITTLRERLDSETLETHWAEGRAMDWEDAVELALRDTPVR
jgi:predicted ATPase/class 3 adenylate cyclase